MHPTVAKYYKQVLKEKKMTPLVDGVKLKIQTVKNMRRKKKYKEPKIVNQ